MVRVLNVLFAFDYGSPHPRGDGPGSGGNIYPFCLFSPPAWGWSVFARYGANNTKVLPTRVGMVRDGKSLRMLDGGSPHPRGDGPPKIAANVPASPFSPPAWGWSAFIHSGGVRRRSPHPRGDGPAAFYLDLIGARFSPPAWGWSASKKRLVPAGCVLPTRVGMVRHLGFRVVKQGRSPHPRGDGPYSLDMELITRRFSPPAWGWSGWPRWSAARA